VLTRFKSISFSLQIESCPTGSPETKAEVMSAAKNAVLGQAGLVDGSGSDQVHGVLTGEGYGG